MKQESGKMTPADVFNTMKKRFKELNLKNIYGVFQFNISGRDGGQWYAVATGDTVDVHPGQTDKPDLIVDTSDKNVVKLAAGKMNPALAVVTRRVKLKGDLTLAAKMQAILTKVL